MQIILLLSKNYKDDDIFLFSYRQFLGGIYKHIKITELAVFVLA